MRTIIVEGFDMVGKTVVGKQFGEGYPSYHFNYDLYDKEFDNRDKCHLFYSMQADLLKFLKENNQVLPKCILFDRSPISSYVYSRVYSGKQQSVYYDDVDAFLTPMINLLDKGEKVKIYYVEHDNQESAERIYNSIQKKRGTHTDKYDYFKDFNEYINNYYASMIQYSQIFNHILEFYSNAIDIYLVKTLSNSSGEQVFLSLPEKWKVE